MRRYRAELVLLIKEHRHHLNTVAELFDKEMDLLDAMQKGKKVSEYWWTNFVVSQRLSCRILVGPLILVTFSSHC